MKGNRINLRIIDGQDRKILLIILGFALTARVFLALFSDNFSHPDENFQILEQAHRLVFGYGVIPWEFQSLARSWIVPGLMAAMLYPFKLLGIDNPDLYIPMVRILFSLVSLSMVVSAFYIGRRFGGARSGLWAAFFCAFWYENIYFSIRPLSEVWATVFFLAAVALVLNAKTRGPILAAGVLAALTVAVRMHFFPAILLLIIFYYFVDRRPHRSAFALGVILALAAAGIIETITLGQPFISYVNYFKLSSAYSLTEAASPGPFDFTLMLGYGSLLVSWLFLISGLWYWKKQQGLILYVLAILSVHSLIPLKEHLISIRFIYPVIPLLMIIGGISVAQLTGRIKSGSYRRLAGVVTAVLFLIISITGAVNLLPGQKSVYGHDIFYHDPTLKAYRYLHDREDVRAVFDNSGFWFESGGFYYLHRDIPLYFNATQPPSADLVSHILTSEDVPWQGDFELLIKIDHIRVYQRVDSNHVYPANPNYSREMF